MSVGKEDVAKTRRSYVSSFLSCALRCISEIYLRDVGVLYFALRLTTDRNHEWFWWLLWCELINAERTSRWEGVSGACSHPRRWASGKNSATVSGFSFWLLVIKSCYPCPRYVQKWIIWVPVSHMRGRRTFARRCSQVLPQHIDRSRLLERNAIGVRSVVLCRFTTWTCQAVDANHPRLTSWPVTKLTQVEYGIVEWDHVVSACLEIM